MLEVQLLVLSVFILQNDYIDYYSPLILQTALKQMYSRDNLNSLQSCYASYVK